jgi:hypothetical protein
MSGCGDIGEYYLPHHPLNPKKIPEFADMASAVFPWAPDLYAKVCASNKEMPTGKRVPSPCSNLCTFILDLVLAASCCFVPHLPWQSHPVAQDKLLLTTSRQRPVPAVECSGSHQSATTCERGVSAMRSPTFGLLSRTSRFPSRRRHGPGYQVHSGIQISFAVLLCSCHVKFVMYFTLQHDDGHGHHSWEDLLTIARNVLGAHLPVGRFLLDVEVTQADVYATSPGKPL